MSMKDLDKGRLGDKFVFSVNLLFLILRKREKERNNVRERESVCVHEFHCGGKLLHGFAKG